MPKKIAENVDSTPKYVELYDKIVARISSGELSAGDKVPSENELIAQFAVSNTTARRTLLELKNNGWVRKVKGSGTYVSENTPSKRIVRRLGSFKAICGSFAGNLERDGYRASAKVVENEIVRGGIETHIGGIRYEIKSDVLKIRCLRYADDILVKNELKYISLAVFPDAPALSPETLSEKLISNPSSKIDKVLRDISAEISTESPENAAFGKTPLPLVWLEGVALDTGGRVAEIEHSFYRGDKYRFFVSAENK